MNWKEFLKPNWKKLIIFILIPVTLNSLAQFFSLQSTFKPELYNIIILIGNPLSGILLSLTEFYPFLFSVGGIIVIAFFAFFDSFYIYFVSCLIVWLYDKFKSVKVKK